MSLAALLADGIAALGLVLAPETRARLLQYLVLIEKWNRTYNLTAVREPEKMLTQHLLDSLSVLPHLAGPRVADVGSGAGLPGIPLALARPDWCVYLFESNRKKTAFLQQARIELKLENVKVIAERVEACQPTEKFDTVISRAFAELTEFVRLAGHLCADDGRLVAMKGVYPHAELRHLPVQFKVEKIVPITVFGLAAERHLIVLKHAQPAEYPAI